MPLLCPRPRVLVLRPAAPTEVGPSTASTRRDGDDVLRLGRRHRLPSPWVQALFDSLFKVLFTFPSQYLCGIGLGHVFSLGRGRPPLRAALPSNATPARWPSPGRSAARDSHPLWWPSLPAPPPRVLRACQRPHSSSRIRGGLLPVRSPLLGESPLISSPPLTDMLKFGGWSPRAQVHV